MGILADFQTFRSRIHDIAGATMIEVALGLTLLIPATCIVLDLSMMFSGYFILQSVASDAVTRAASITNIDLDLKGQGETSYSCTNFKEAFYRVEEVAKNGIQLGGFIRDITGSGGLLELLPFTYSDVTAADSPCLASNSFKSRSVGLLRPGEMLYAKNGTSLSPVDNPYLSGVSGIPAETQTSLMKRHKLLVHLRAKYHGLLLNNLVISASAQRLHQPIPQTNFGLIHDETGNLIPSSLSPPDTPIPPSPLAIPADTALGNAPLEMYVTNCPKLFNLCPKTVGSGCQSCVGLGAS